MNMINKIIMDLLIKNPYYGYLASKVSFRIDEKVKRMKLKFDSMPIVLYNEEWFRELDESKQISSVIHELLHIGLLHFYRRDGRELILWNVACDIAVSELMDEFDIHEDIITVDVVEKELNIKLPKLKTAEFYYMELMEVDESFNFTFQEGEATIVFESDREYHGEILDEMMNDDLSTKNMLDELTKVQDSAFGENVMKDNLAQQTDGIYKEYKVNWRNVLKRFLTGHGKIKTRKSYKRQSRRFDNLPGTKRSIGVRALLAIDESASISDTDVESFHNELTKINRITGADIIATRFDSQCSEPINLSSFVANSKRERRGGTDFRPVFELADSLKTPLVILFTDGDGKAPEVVNHKVLWVLTNNGKKPVDYGIEVRFDVD